VALLDDIFLVHRLSCAGLVLVAVGG